MYCVSCGKETSNIYKGCCIACFLKNETFCSPPKKIDVFECRHCGAFKIEKKWEKETLDAVRAQFLKKYVKKSLDSVNILFNEDKDEAIFQMKFNGVPFEGRKKIMMRLKKSLCDTCSKIMGGYFEAVVQVRGEKHLKNAEIEMADDIVQKILGEKRKAFITKREERHGGVDYYLGDRHDAADIAKQMKDHFHAEMTVSSSLVGMREGKEVYRTTYSVRAPAYSKGSYVEIDGSVYTIEDIAKKVRLFDLTTGRERYVYKKDMKKAVLIDAEEQEAVVLSTKGRELHIMDPDIFKTVVVLTPLEIKEATVYVIKWKGRLYVTGTNKH
jgi:nonsense-mediated mRNA decay protein 3